MEVAIDCSLNNVGLSIWENGVLQQLLLLRNDKLKYQKKVLKSEILANKVQNIFNFLDENVFWSTDVVFIEKPSGSQDSNGMVNYAIEIAIYSYLKNKGLNVQWVKVNDVKRALTGKKDATKQEMIEAAHKMFPHSLCPEFDWLTDKNGRLYNFNEHLSDSIGIYLAGSETSKIIAKI